MSMMLYPCMFCVALLMDLFVLRCSVGQTMYDLPKNVCVVPVIPVSV